jgi:tripartite ATP-independent transporter DctM subunit
VLLDGLLVLSLPVVIIRGAITGVFTTTEAGGIAVIYSTFLGMVVFRTLTFRGLWQALKVTGGITASIYLILATSEVMSYAFTLAGLDAYVRGFGDLFAGQPMLFLFAVVAILLIIGTFLEPGPAVILFVPLLLPAVQALQIDEIQFAMVTLLTLNIGLITPPVGVVMFVVGRLANLDMWELFRGIWPFFLAEAGVIVLLCLFPQLSSGLPHVLRG